MNNLLITMNYIIHHWQDKIIQSCLGHQQLRLVLKESLMARHLASWTNISTGWWVADLMAWDTVYTDQADMNRLPSLTFCGPELSLFLEEIEVWSRMFQKLSPNSPTLPYCCVPSNGFLWKKQKLASSHQLNTLFNPCLHHVSFEPLEWLDSTDHPLRYK